MIYFSGVVVKTDWEGWIHETLAEREPHILSASSVSSKDEGTDFWPKSYILNGVGSTRYLF